MNIKSLIIIAGSLYACLNIKGTDGQNHLIINEQEYLESKSLSVLVYHNIYPVGMQGGIEIIQHNRRTATNGSVSVDMKKDVELIPGVNTSAVPIPRIENPERIVEGERIRLPFEHESIHLEYELIVSPAANQGFEVELNFLSPVDTEKIEAVWFSMEFYPEFYAGKSFRSENGFGVFPFQYKGSVSKGRAIPMATGNEFVFAPEDESIKITISSSAGEMVLEDSRLDSRRYWFTLRTRADISKTEGAVSLLFQPNLIDGWSKSPMIAYSQIGYHPDQKKSAIIELDPGISESGRAKLLRLSSNGDYEELEAGITEFRGKFLRYNYAEFDFTDVREDGIYKITFEDSETGPFVISTTVYGKGPWELSLDVFYPVQMCHMKVIDRLKVWHGACHMDDALQVPSPKPFFDGYYQSDDPDSEYEPHTTIKGLNTGGWHDAADDDIHYVSTGRAAYDLALAVEEFGLERDQTTVDFENKEVRLYEPDGIPDAIQQIIHGTHWLVAHYRVSDHAFPGVISSNWDTYVTSADWGLFTDNLFYRPDYPEDSTDAVYSGRLDDRYVFTNRDTRRDYFAASVLAAVSRIIREYDDELAVECIETAVEIWERESGREPKFYRTVGTPRSLAGEKSNAAVELYLSTGKQEYLDFIAGFKDKIMKDMPNCAWTVSRVLESISDTEFRSEFISGLVKYCDELMLDRSDNPFGIKYTRQVWGIGWEVLWQAAREYYLIKHHPDIFDMEYLLDALGFVLGRHPGNNLSFVSGVGSHRPIPSFALNKSDYGYIPGGVYSGTSLVLPDFPELRDDHPFLWQQSEIMIWGATPYIFSVLAADRLLNR